MTSGNTTDELVKRIRDDRENGASELARQCLAGLARRARVLDADGAEGLRNKLVELAKQLQNTRPTMAVIIKLVGQWIDAVERLSTDNVDKLRNEASACAEKLIRISTDAVSKAALNAANLIGVDKTIITHSLSSTVIAVFEQAAPRVKAIVTESQPPGEGRQLAAKLSKLGIATDFISDQQMGLFVTQADVALVGADTIAADGSVINKAGTYLLALAAREQGIPFYVCFESFKCSDLVSTDIVLEQHDPAEFDPPELPHVKAHNIYFDTTPPNLITSWITEDGVSRKPGGQTSI
ncbi:MAG: translation initiation factor eIF-2B [Acidiferrobacterales bacterium]